MKVIDKVRHRGGNLYANELGSVLAMTEEKNKTHGRAHRLSGRARDRLYRSSSGQGPSEEINAQFSALHCTVESRATKVKVFTPDKALSFEARMTRSSATLVMVPVLTMFGACRLTF